MLIGRRPEKTTLDEALASPEAELVAVYGRRRVGKTFLVREHLRDAILFELTGMHDTARSVQLRNFAVALRDAAGLPMVPEAPPDWFSAFVQLRPLVRLRPRDEPVVLFFDELPWLASRRSGFLPAFEHFWNSWASRQPNLVVVICGSAASWMINRVIRARGGLYNRVTRRIQLLPFTLAETREYLDARGMAELGSYQTLEVYMAMGGIPHYLKEVRRGESATQNIDRICFSDAGLLRNEFGVMYGSLFEHSDRHEAIVRALASKGGGLTRQRLAAETGLASGGTLTKILQELEASGFIHCLSHFRRRKKDAVYRLSDPHSRFHVRWIERSGTGSPNAWTTRRGTPAWRAWSGHTFEGICIAHLSQLKRALGIEAVETSASTWAHPGQDGAPGAQIDLLIDRKDATVSLCEMKFSDGPFTIDKRYADVLRTKRQVFRDVTGSRKAIQIAMVTTYGVTPNAYRDELVARTVEMEALFQP